MSKNSVLVAGLKLVLENSCGDKESKVRQRQATKAINRQTDQIELNGGALIVVQLARNHEALVEIMNFSFSKYFF